MTRLVDGYCSKYQTIAWQMYCVQPQCLRFYFIFYIIVIIQRNKNKNKSWIKSPLSLVRPIRGIRRCFASLCTALWRICLTWSIPDLRVEKIQDYWQLVSFVPSQTVHSGLMASYLWTLTIISSILVSRDRNICTDETWTVSPVGLYVNK